VSVVDNAVRIRQRGNGSENLVALQVEDDDPAGAAAVGDEAAVNTRHDGDAVIVLLAGDVAENLAIFVEHHRVGAARDKEMVILRVNGDVVPAAFTAYVEGAGDLPLLSRRCGAEEEGGQNGEDRITHVREVSPWWISRTWTIPRQLLSLAERQMRNAPRMDCGSDSNCSQGNVCMTSSRPMLMPL